ncbi:unnamed protein product [Pylaiella littoralis]
MHDELSPPPRDGDSSCTREMIQGPTSALPTTAPEQAPAPTRGEGGEAGGRDTLESSGEISSSPSANTGQVQQWLVIGKKAAESKCTELEKQLAATREELTKRDTSVKVAHEKIRHLEAEAKGLLLAAEFREREASSMQEGANLALERAQAHERALASALEQLSDSGVSQSRKLAELADVSDELRRTKAALERAERLVFDQRREADERQSDADRRTAEMAGLRDKLNAIERKNTELLATQAAGRLAKRMRGNFGRSSTFCASFCSCFRSKPAYRRVASPAPLAPPFSSPSVDSPWLGEEASSLRGL